MLPGNDLWGRALLDYQEGEGYIFLEHMTRPPTLYIFGGGHISLCLAWIAHRVGFEVIVLDERSAFANRERFPMASEVRVVPYTDAFKNLKLGTNDFVAIITHGHSHDLKVLRHQRTLHQKLGEYFIELGILSAGEVEHLAKKLAEHNQRIFLCGTNGKKAQTPRG